MSETENGAQIGKEAPKSDSLEFKTSANTTLAAIKTEARKFIDDLENVPDEVRQELLKLWHAFHDRATTVVSEIPAEPIDSDPAAKSVASQEPQEL